MVKKILKAILAVLAVVTAFICGAYVQSSTGRQMPVMAQRRNALSDYGVITTNEFSNELYNQDIIYNYSGLDDVDIIPNPQSVVAYLDEHIQFNDISNCVNIGFDINAENIDFFSGTVTINLVFNQLLSPSSGYYYFYWNQDYSIQGFNGFYFDCLVKSIYSYNISGDIYSYNLPDYDRNTFLINSLGSNNVNDVLSDIFITLYISAEAYEYIGDFSLYFSFYYSLYDISPLIDTFYDNGYENGYGEGYDEGDLDGYDRGYDEGTDRGYNEGYNIGYNEGTDRGYNEGYNEGYTSGVAASSDPYYDLTDAKFDLGMLDNNNDFYYVFRNHDIELVDNYYDFTQYVFNALSEYHSEGYESEYIELELYDFNSFNGASFEINVQGFTKIYINYDRNETEVVNIGDPSSLETIELRSEGLVTDFTLLVDPNYTNQQTYKLGFNYLNTYENGYESGYMTGLKNGRNEVIDDPNKYNLYNTTQYDNYGKAQYQTGYNEGIRQEAPTGLEWFKSAISVTNAFLDIQILPGVKLIHICGGFIILGLLKWILDWFRG